MANAAEGMHYVNLAAAIDTLAWCLQCQEEAHRKLHEPADSLHEREFRWQRFDQESFFTAGVSYAISMMLEPETAAIIEQAARERAEETTA